MSERRLAGLDALRGIAAVSVMTYHYTTWYNQTMGGHAPPGVSFSLPYGNFGVDLFFIISGFVIFMTIERTQLLSDFLVSRLARLYPAFLASLACTLLLGLALDDFGPPFDLARIAVNLTMAPELFNTQAIDGSYWSLLYELAFYLLAAGVWFGLCWRSPEANCAVWLLASLGLRFAGLGFSYLWLVQLTAAPFSQLFVIGIMLYRLRSGRTQPLTLAVLMLAFAMTLFGPHATLYPISRPVYACLMLGFAGSVWLATSPGAQWAAVLPLRFLGRISYPLYLLHQEAGLTVIARLEAAGVTPDLAVAMTAAAAIALAWGISTAVEYPAQNWLRGCYRRWRERRPSLAVRARTVTADISNRAA